MKPKRFRRTIRQEVTRAQGGLWKCLCRNQWRVRAVLAARLLFGRPFGVWKGAA